MSGKRSMSVIFLLGISYHKLPLIFHLFQTKQKVKSLLVGLSLQPLHFLGT